MTSLLREGERLDDLECGGYRLIQRRDGFRFTTDSVLLADFARPRKWDRAVDLGCGTGVIATLLVAHCEGVTVDAIEIQEDVADMAARSVSLNRLEDRVRVHRMDMRDAWKTLGAGKYTLAVCNPPYGRAGAALLSESEEKRLSRHEAALTIDDVALSASKLLRTGGRFAAVFPAPRAFELMRAMQDNGMAPKRVRTVHGVEGRAPKLILIDAVRGGGEGLEWLPPLTLQREDGTPTEEWKRIYGK